MLAHTRAAINCKELPSRGLMEAKLRVRIQGNRNDASSGVREESFGQLQDGSWSLATCHWLDRSQHVNVVEQIKSTALG